MLEGGARNPDEDLWTVVLGVPPQGARLDRDTLRQGRVGPEGVDIPPGQERPQLEDETTWRGEHVVDHHHRALAVDRRHSLAQLDARDPPLEDRKQVAAEGGEQAVSLGVDHARIAVGAQLVAVLAQVQGLIELGHGHHPPHGGIEGHHQQSVVAP